MLNNESVIVTGHFYEGTATKHCADSDSQMGNLNNTGTLESFGEILETCALTTENGHLEKLLENNVTRTNERLVKER